MRYTTKTEYGLICLTYMARHYEPTRVFTIKEIAGEEQYSQAYVEKIFQSLRAVDIVTAHHGKQGGYSLGRHPSRIYLKEIIEALEGGTFDIFCDSPVKDEIVCTHQSFCGTRPLWQKTRELLDGFYGSISLEVFTKEEIESAKVIGLLAQPVKFGINSRIKSHESQSRAQ